MPRPLSLGSDVELGHRWRLRICPNANAGALVRVRPGYGKDTVGELCSLRFTRPVALLLELLMASPRVRAHAHSLAEYARQVRLVTQAATQRDFAERFGGFEHQLLST